MHRNDIGRLLTFVLFVASLTVAGQGSGLPVTLGARALSYLAEADQDNPPVYAVEQAPYAAETAAKLRHAVGFHGGDLAPTPTGSLIVRDADGRQLGFDPGTSTYYYDDPRLVLPVPPLPEKALLDRAWAVLRTVVDDPAGWVYVSTDVESLMVADVSRRAYLSKCAYSFSRKLSGRLVLSRAAGVDIGLGPDGTLLSVDARFPHFKAHGVVARQAARRALVPRVQELFIRGRLAVDDAECDPQEVTVVKCVDSYFGVRREGKELLVPHTSAYCEIRGKDGLVHGATMHFTQDASMAQGGLAPGNVIDNIK